MALEEYKRKRHFQHTPEPEGLAKTKRKAKRLSFVIQKHAATRLHYDFRLELDGVLKSWAVPKGPSLDPKEKRLAVEVEDHPLAYANFEGVIPEGQYGGGEVIVWDRGHWMPTDDPHQGLDKGKLDFELDGEKLHGGWTLVRLRRQQGGKPAWLLIKRTDDAARPASEYDITEQQPTSIKTGRTVEGLAKPAQSAKKAAARTKKSPPKKAAKRRTPSARSTARATRRPSAANKRKSGKKAARKKKANMPQQVELQLATLSDQAPSGAEWIHEMKFDGYRILARLENGQVRLITRNQQDWTHRYPAVANDLEKLPVDSALLDGELVALLPSGLSSFQALQNALRRGDQTHLAYFLFDLLYLNGQDYEALPLLERKAALAKLLARHKNSHLQFSEHVEGNGPAFFRESCQMGLEGIISKRADRSYHPGRSEEWLKTKCIGREELVIGGYTLSPAAQRGIGAILVGYFDRGDFVYAGRVGTGFNAQMLADLRERFQAIQQTDNPFREVPAKERSSRVRWVRPQYVAEIEFTGWTEAGVLRHPSFQGLREDKPAQQVTRPPSLRLPQAEDLDMNQRTSTARKRTAKKAAAKKIVAKRSSAQSTDLPVELSHPERVLFPECGLTKLGLATYYAEVAEWILPHLKDRPLSLVRCPEGKDAGNCFFQKHVRHVPPALEEVEIEEKNKTETYVMANNRKGLLSLVQINVLEIHTWGSRSDRLEQPDRLVFDLDPGEDVAWERVVQAAFRVRDRLQELGLTSFLKTTGGKGLHIVAPLSPRRPAWETVKGFTRQVAEQLAAEAPDEFIATMSKAARQGKIFIDYLRNDRGATAVAPYSTRSKDGATISMPLAWDELTPALRSDHFRVENVAAHLRSRKQDPWKAFFRTRQSLPKGV
jgi:bifunctional non-homologous end joining protein LigD